jgi:hypothetical protein
MKRLILPLVLAASLSGVGVASAQSAASTTHTFVYLDESFTDTELCGFQLNFQLQGKFQLTDFFDASGTLVKEISAGPSTFTLTNPANGKTATTTSTWANITTFNPDGSINTVTQSGLIANFVLPGVGTIVMDVGTVQFDSEGNIVFVRGPHQLLMGDIEGFCDALADP